MFSLRLSTAARSVGSNFWSRQAYSTKTTAPLFNLKTSHDDSLLTVSMNSAPFNLCDTNNMHDLDVQLGEALQNNKVRLLVLESAVPNMFSMGLNPGYILKAPFPDGRRQIFHTMITLFRRIYAAPVPTVVKIEGPCFAAGAILALACDFRLMNSSHAKISFSESKVGLPIPKALTNIIAKNVNNNSHTISDFTVFGRAFDAETCRKAGFIVPEHFSTTAEMDLYVQDRLAKVSRLSRTVLSNTILNVKADDIQNIDELLKGGLHDMTPFLDNDYLGEGLTAYVKQREPVWKN